jgi:hypothetical protein
MLSVKRIGLGVLCAFVLVAQFLIVGSLVRAEGSGNLCLAADAPGCSFGLPTFQYQLLLGEMAAHPSPDVRPLEVDMSELGYSAYNRVIGGSAPLYDAPNGHQVGVIDAGFNYVNVISRKAGWVQVMIGRWLPLTDLTSASSSTFTGVLFEHPLAYPMAWVLLPTLPSAIPGAAPEDDVPMLKRYQRVNIFATATVGDWDWYLVGPGQWIEQRRVARVLPATKPEQVKGRWVAVDLYEQVLFAYEDDQMVFATMISSGLPRQGWGTNKGLFRIWSRLRSDTMTGGFGRPDYYNLPDVPWVMYFDGSIALHGAYWHDGFGYRHSHGCVNMSVTDAHWLYDWTNGFYANTWVYVYSSRDGLKPSK